jgi:hypothetical protein
LIITKWNSSGDAIFSPFFDPPRGGPLAGVEARVSLSAHRRAADRRRHDGERDMCPESPKVLPLVLL